jgi:hypothetical protein
MGDLYCSKLDLNGLGIGFYIYGLALSIFSIVLAEIGEFTLGEMFLND